MRPQMKENFYEDSSVSLDGFDWIGCSFKNCELVINEGDFSFMNNHITDCRLKFGGNAVAILSMLELFYPGKIPFNGNRPNPRGKDIY